MTANNRLAVVVGRFQVPKLSPGHEALFATAMAECGEVLVVEGVPYQTSENDPYDAELQRIYFAERFKGMPVRVVENPTPNDASPELRSRMLDELIEDERRGKEAVVYGSSDSIVHRYTGRFAKRELDPVSSRRGTDIRKAIVPQASEAFREGVAYAARIRKTISNPAVDVAPVSANIGKVLMLSKPEDEGKLRFAGVFYDPTQDRSFEDSARRAIQKELSGSGASVSVPVGSRQITDPKFKRTRDGVITTLVRASWDGTMPTNTEAGVEAVVAEMWFEPGSIPDIVEMHRPLAELLMHRWSGC